MCVCGGVGGCGLSSLSLYTYIKRPPSEDTCLSTLGLHFMEQKPLSSFKWCDGLDLVLFLQKKNKQTKPKAWEQGHKMGMGTMETRDPIHMPMECGSKEIHRKEASEFPCEEEIASVDCSPFRRPGLV